MMEYIVLFVLLTIILIFHLFEIKVFKTFKETENELSVYKKRTLHFDKELADRELKMSDMKLIIGNLEDEKAKLKEILERHTRTSRDYAQRLGDLTEEAAEQRLKRKTLIQSIGIGVMNLSLKGIIEEMNPAAERLTMFSAENIVGRATPISFHLRSELLERAEQLEKLLNKIIAPNIQTITEIALIHNTEEREWTIIRKDGTSFIAKVIISLIYNRHKEVAGFNYVFYEVSQYKEFEEEISHAYRSLIRTNLELDNIQKKILTNTEELIKAKNDVIRYRERVDNISKIIKNIAQTGLLLTEQNSLETIVETAYTKISQLVDASVISIGIFDETNNRLSFYGTRDKMDKLPAFHFSCSETDNLMVWSFQNKKSLLLNIFCTEYKTYVPTFVPIKPGEQANSILVVPLLYNNKALGVVSIQNYRESAYSAFQKSLLYAVSNYISYALFGLDIKSELDMNSVELKQSVDSLSIHETELNLSKQLLSTMEMNQVLLYKMGKEILQLNSVEKIINNLFININSMLDAPVFSIGLFNQEMQTIDFYGKRIDNEIIIKGSDTLSEDDYLSVWCFKNQKTVFINNFRKEYRKYVYRMIVPEPGDLRKAMLYIPLTFNSKKIGVLTTQSYQKYIYTEYHINLLKTIGLFISQALYNEIKQVDS